MDPKLVAAISAHGMSLPELLEYLAASILVLRVRDGVPVSSEMARERANNIAQALPLLGVLRVRS